jgi:hypothetical protein
MDKNDMPDFKFFEGNEFFVSFDLIRVSMGENIGYSPIIRFTIMGNNEQYSFQSPVWFKSPYIAILDLCSFFSERFQVSDAECAIYDYESGKVCEVFSFENGVVKQLDPAVIDEMNDDNDLSVEVELEPEVKSNKPKVINFPVRKKIAPEPTTKETEPLGGDDGPIVA